MPWFGSIQVQYPPRYPPLYGAHGGGSNRYRLNSGPFMMGQRGRSSRVSVKRLIGRSLEAGESNRTLRCKMQKQQQTDPLTEAMVNKRDPLAAGEVNKLVGEVRAPSGEKPVEGSEGESTKEKEQDHAPTIASHGEEASAQDVPTAADASDILVVRRSVLETDSSLE